MKHIIVSGASGNLGSAVSEKFLENGHKVFGVMSRKHEQLSANAHRQFIPVVADLTDEAETSAAVASILETHPVIDVAVLTAGGFAMGDIAATGEEGLKKMIDINFITAYNLVRPIFEQMKQQGSGRIFLIGAKAGIYMNASSVAYSLSKSLVFRLAEMLNSDVGKKDVVVSVVVPGTIDTPENRETMPDADFHKWVKPWAIAELIYYHTTPAAAILRDPVIKVYGQS